MIRVTLLGCGGSAGVPMLGGADGRGEWGRCDPAEPRNCRTRSSIVIEAQDGRRLLVDTSPDMRAQLLACAVPRIDAILWTHAHADHITGLDDVRILNRIADSPLDSYGTESTLEEIETRFGYAFRPWQPPGFYRPVFRAHAIHAGETIRAAGLTIRTFAQDHGRVTTLGLRVGAFGYSTDVVNLDDAGFTALKGVETWIVGCFGLTPHPTHAHLDRVLGWAERVGARRTILTHMGTDMDWAFLTQRLPPDVEPGIDGLLLTSQ